MKIYIVRHAKSLSEDIDKEQPISFEGKEETEKLACFIRMHLAIQLEMVLCSEKLRSIDTAGIFAKYISSNLQTTRELNPDGDVDKVLGLIKDYNEVMIIGHLPLLSKLISKLICNNEEYELIKIINSMVICIEGDFNTNKWFIDWILYPSIIR